MILLRLFEIAVILMTLTLLITQVIVPAFRGTRFFPLFDQRRQEALDKLVDARDDAELDRVKRATQTAQQHKGDHSNV
ncbi:MAG: hypothetical protein ABI411_18175 [Tahibacter sp.]